MPFAPFVPLRVLSSYSMLEGAIDPKDIAKLAKERGFPAIAICDRNGLYGIMAFAAACKGEGVQPIIGALLGVARDETRGTVDYLPLFAQDDAGYDNLCHLVSAAHLDRPLERDPHVTLDDLAGRTDGLIALTGAGEGGLTRLLAEGQKDAADRLADHLMALFPGRLYIELARAGDPVCERAEDALVDLAYARDLPLVATNPANFAEPHMHKAHDAMLCIANSTQIEADDRPRSNPQAFVKQASMMEEGFADLPEATANTLVIAQRCAFAPPYRKPILPSLAGDLAGEARMLAEDSRAGFEAKADMLSITGLTLDQFADLMQGLGYRAEKGDRPRQRPAPEVAAPEAAAPEAEAVAETPEAAPAPEAVVETPAPEPVTEVAHEAAPERAEAQPEETEVFYTFTWGGNRRQDRRPKGRPQGKTDRPDAPRGDRPQGRPQKPAKGKPKGRRDGKPEDKGPRSFEARPPRPEKKIDPDNPFAAALMGLKGKV